MGTERCRDTAKMADGQSAVVHAMKKLQFCLSIARVMMASLTNMTPFFSVVGFLDVKGKADVTFGLGRDILYASVPADEVVKLRTRGRRVLRTVWRMRQSWMPKSRQSLSSGITLTTSGDTVCFQTWPCK